MLKEVRPGSVVLDLADFMPPILRPLVDASKRNESIENCLHTIIHGLGFENFTYGASASFHPNHESRSYVFTTLPRAWVARYDQSAYIEVDTRVPRALDRKLPLIWSYATEYGRSHQMDAFLDDSLAHGVGSGIIFGMHGAPTSSVIVSLSRADAAIDYLRRESMRCQLGDIVLLGMYFHELFMKDVVERGIAPKSQGAPLSEREKECLTLAAHGQTSHDIAFKLDITERTVQFHFDGIRSKLAAANRQEAIAKAVAAGIIEP